MFLLPKKFLATLEQQHFSVIQIIIWHALWNINGYRTVQTTFTMFLSKCLHFTKHMRVIHTGYTIIYNWHVQHLKKKLRYWLAFGLVESYKSPESYLQNSLKKMKKCIKYKRVLSFITKLIKPKSDLVSYYQYTPFLKNIHKPRQNPKLG